MATVKGMGVPWGHGTLMAGKVPQPMKVRTLKRRGVTFRERNTCERILIR